MHFRLGVNPQHVTEWKKGRSNPSGETTLAIMGIAEERTGGARTALSSADRFAKDFSSGPDFVNQTHGLSGKEAHRLDVSGIPTLLFSERFAPDELIGCLQQIPFGFRCKGYRAPGRRCWTSE